MYMYILNMYGKIHGGIPKMFVFLQISQNIDGSDNTIHKAFRIHKTLYTNPLDNLFFSTIYHK